MSYSSVEKVLCPNEKRIKELMSEDSKRNNYKLLLPNFIESIFRIAAIYPETRKETISLAFENLIRAFVVRDTSSLEGFLLVDQIFRENIMKIINHYKKELKEVYDKFKSAEWDRFGTSHYSTFGKITLNEYLNFLRKSYILETGLSSNTLQEQKPSQEISSRPTVRRLGTSQFFDIRESFSGKEGFVTFHTLGHKIFCGPEDIKGRTSEFRITPYKSVEYFLSVMHDSQSLVMVDQKPTPSDFALGFGEFMDLIGVLGASAWRRLKEFEVSTLSQAIDKFINRILTQHNITLTKRILSESN